MSGVLVPANPIVKPFGKDAVSPADITLPIPVESQVGITPGAASFDTGFPAATRTDPEAGGIAPFGQDFNGMFYMLSAYCALLQAGQLCNWNDDAQDAFTGYRVGATLDSATTPGLRWTNNVDGNTNDPDAVPTGWIASTPRYVTTAPAAGAYDNLALPGPSDYYWDVDTTAGAVDFTGFIAQRDGQRIYLSATGANLLRVMALTGSTGPRQVRIPADLGILQNQTLTLQYSATIGKWLAV